MKRRVIVKIVFLTLCFESLILGNVMGITYDLGVSKGDGFIYTVDNFDKTQYMTFFLENPPFRKDEQKKQDITSIVEKDEYWNITYDYWDWTSNPNRFLEEAEDVRNIIIYKNAADAANNSYTLEAILEMWIIPVPYINYLQEYVNNYQFQFINVMVQGSGISVKYAFSSLDYQIMISYTLNGVVETIEYARISSDNVFLTISLSRDVSIPGFNLFISFSIIILVSLITIIKRRAILSLNEK